MLSKEPTIAVICLGTELTQGFTLNTNAKFISSRAGELGFDTVFHLTLPDDPALLQAAFQMALNAGVQAVIISGGLGPTDDDKTRFFMAETLSRPLVYQEEWNAQIRKWFSDRGRPYFDENRIQAYFPEGSIVLENPVGTAPGFMIIHEGVTFFVIPGVPAEAEVLFEKHIASWLSSKHFQPLCSKELHLINIPESELEFHLKKIVFPSSVSWSSLPEKDGLIFRVYTHEHPELLHSVIHSVREILLKESVAVIFSEDENDLILSIMKLLQEKNETFGCAESCTGGLIASEIIQHPGASKTFRGAVVAYHNDIKSDLLKISPQWILENGAVSEPIVRAMAENARKILGTHWALATSGVAGPDGGTLEKPVGLVWMAIAGERKTYSFFENFSGNREQIRLKSVYKVLQQFYRLLTKQKDTCTLVQ